MATSVLTHSYTQAKFDCGLNQSDSLKEELYELTLEGLLTSLFLD